MATLIETPAELGISSQPETEPEALQLVAPSSEVEQTAEASAEKNSEVNLNSSRPTFQLRCEEHTGAHRFGFCLDCNQVGIF